MAINLVLYSKNEPFNTVKEITINSIKNVSNRNVIVHDYTLEKIKLCPWFNKIENLLNINKEGRRDGYYNSWKPYIIKDVYDKINYNDIIYYVDCSQYFKSGFTESIDKICNVVNEIGFIAGAVADDVLNNSYNCCNNIDIWNLINPNVDNTKYLDKRHVLNSFFILKKNDINTKFIEEWTYFTTYKDDKYLPLVVYHHTVDQSIFNILVYKYNLPVFYYKLNKHDQNKNKNIILHIINNNNNIQDYIIKANH